MPIAASCLDGAWAGRLVYRAIATCLPGPTTSLAIFDTDTCIDLGYGVFGVLTTISLGAHIELFIAATLLSHLGEEGFKLNPTSAGE